MGSFVCLLAASVAAQLATPADLPADWHAAARDLRDEVFARRAELGADSGLRHKLNLATLYHGLGSPEGVLAAGYFLHRFPEKAAAAAGLEDLSVFLVSERYHEALLREGDRYFAGKEAWPRDAPLASRLPPEVLTGLLANTALVDALAENLRPDDYLPGAWRVLGDLQAANPAAVARHPRLAVALALVYDEPPPADWPHNQVEATRVPRADRPWQELFTLFARAQEGGQLKTDLDALPVRRLKYVIDAPLPAAEWDWARGHVRLATDDFLDAYYLVRYNRTRWQRGQLVWRGKPYTLETLRLAGGICTDQAYFAAVAGKAHGLPTAFFVGEGDTEGHAWFGYLPAADAGWRTNANIALRAMGYAYDPQNWTRRSLPAFRKDIEPAGPATPLRRLAALYATPETRTKLLHEALALDNNDAAAWEALADTLDGAAREKALAEMDRLFADQPDVRYAVRLRQLADAEAAGRGEETARLRHWLLTERVDGRPDLALRGASELLQRDVRAGRYGDAVDAFKARLRAGGDAPVGETFYGLVWPFVRDLAASGQPALAQDSLDYARQALNLHNGTRLHRASLQLERYVRQRQAEL